MTKSGLWAGLIGVGLTLAVAGAAQAHAHLVASSPAANSAGAAPAQIRLTFSEALEPKFSGFDLAMADGMKVALAVGADPGDAKALVGAVKTPLRPGVYKVQWRAVSRDTHRTTGAYSFTVR